MTTKPRPLSINLMPQDPFYETPLGRMLLWASNIGRYLVVFTELIVIISFATRFKLDRDLTDLNSGITQKSNLISSYGSLENDVRTIQKKTEFLAQQKALLTPLDILDTVSTLIPPNVVLSVTQLHDQQVQVVGTAPSSKDLAMFVVNVQRKSLVKGLVVDQVKSSDQGAAGFEFTMRIALAR